MFTGAAAPAARPEAAPYLLQEDLQPNQTQSGKQPVEPTMTGTDVEKVSEVASGSGTGSDLATVPVTHANATANTTTLVRLMQVSAVHRGDTERSEGPTSSPVFQSVMFSLMFGGKSGPFPGLEHSRFPPSVSGV